MPDSNEPKAPPPKKYTGNLEADIRKRVLARDRRYEISAYMFIYESLAYTQRRLGRDGAALGAAERHVTGQELLQGIREYAGKIFGPLAPTVFRSWGVTRTEDFGELVFNLVESDLLGKTETDRREDFGGGFDFDSAFDEPFEVKPE